MENTFSIASKSYQQFRPRYPLELYQWILEHVEHKDSAWDCGAGNGQAAFDLADFFGHVEASDVSAEQIDACLAKKNIRYSVQAAEQTNFAEQSFDLVVVAQALHWFDFSRFWQEVSRVGKKGSFFCAWGYAWMQSKSGLTHDLFQPYRELIAPFWAPNNKILWDGYPIASVSFPWKMVKSPEYSIRVNWSVLELIAYMRTWSASKKALLDLDVARNILELEEKAIRKYGENEIFEVAMPLSVLAGYIGSNLQSGS